MHDKIYFSCYYYVIHTTNHCIAKYIWVVIIMLCILQIIAWPNIFELSLLCYTYYKSLHDKIYLSCHYCVIHNTNHCMTKYIWVAIIMLYILEFIAWPNIFELSLLRYTYYKSLHAKIYLSCHYCVMHTTNHCMTKYIWVFIICYTCYKSLHDKIYLSCHYYVVHNTNHCMTKYIWVFIICYTHYKSLHDKIYLSCHYYVMHTTNHCMTWYIWVVIIMLYIIQIVAWQNIFEFSLSVVHTTNHCMTKYIWVVIIMLCILQIIAWHDIFELSLLCYT